MIVRTLAARRRRARHRRRSSGVLFVAAGAGPALRGARDAGATPAPLDGRQGGSARPALFAIVQGFVAALDLLLARASSPSARSA